MPTICAEFGIRTSATRGVSARGACDERDAVCCRVAKTRRCRPFARRRRASRANTNFANTSDARDDGENAKPSSTRSSREKPRLSCTVLSAKRLPSMWRSPPSVARVLTSRRAAERGERRDREPRDVPSGRSRVVASGTSRAGRVDVVRASRHRSRAAPRHRASLRVGVGRDALSSAREQTRRRAVRANQTRARWMTHLVPRGPVPRAPLHHLQLVLDQSELLRTGRAFARAGRG